MDAPDAPPAPSSCPRATPHTLPPPSPPPPPAPALHCRRLKAAQPGGQEWRDLVAFLQELCGLTKHLQAQQRNSLLLRLVGLGLFQVGGVGVVGGGWVGAWEGMRCKDGWLAERPRTQGTRVHPGGCLHECQPCVHV